LVSLGSAVLPHGAVEEGVIQEPEAIAQVITALLKNLGIKKKKVAISISGYSVIVKKINLAVMGEAQMEDYIQAEAEQYIPFDIDDIYLDFQNLKTNTAESNRTDVMLVAAKKELVDSYLALLQSAGLQAVIVDVDGFALENAFEATDETRADVALVDIGATKMNINIISQGISILARDVMAGSSRLTELIQRRFGLRFEEAEALKIGLVPAADKQKELEEIFADTCLQWVQEIKKAVDLYHNNNSRTSLSRLVLSGGGARIKGLAQLLQEETGIPVETFNPFAGIIVDQQKINANYLRYIAPEMAISMGLAIRPTVL